MRIWVGVVATVGLVMTAGLDTAWGQERLPQQVAGTWRITRVLPARSGAACWTEKEAQPLVGSLLDYTQHSMRWQGGTVALHGITTRVVSSAELAEEAPAGEGRAALRLTDLGIQAKGVTEVNLQHDDMDITGATTEVPGDSVLAAGPGRIVVSACGVYMEARRVSGRQPVAATAGVAGSVAKKGM